MGLLDDAIRQHIELKRSHGADPAEVARLEREAFGPATQAPQPLEIATDAPREPVDPALIEPEVDAPAPDQHAFEEPLAPELEPEPATRLARLEPEQPVASEAVPEPQPQVHAEPPVPAPEPEPVVHQQPPEPAEEPVWDDPGARTRPFSADEVAEAQSAAGEVEPEEAADSEDVLEETPEFLQETPEHDRLWFEQRPPRDFDFDG